MRRSAARPPTRQPRRPTPSSPQPKGHTLAQQPLVVLLFLLLATCTQMCLAMYGVLSRWLQVGGCPAA